MADKEHRTGETHSSRELQRELNEAQRLTLASLEKFGWELKFIRHPMFQPLIPVVFDPDRKKYAVLEADGTLNEAAALVIRD
nr:hypothetical protein [Thermomonas sp.]